MKKLISLALAALGFAAQAAEPFTVELWPDGAPNAFPTQLSAEYRAANNLPDSPVLVIFEAENPCGKAVVGCPGGGYGHLAKFHEGIDFAQWYNDQGITYGMLLYRVPEQHHDVPLSDAHRAIEIMRALPGICEVGIMGFSAGGHLASTAATHYTEANRPDFQILFYPVITMNPRFTHGGTRHGLIGPDAPKALETYYSNELQVNADAPRAIIFHCQDDDAVPVENAIRYFEALTAAGVPAELHIYPTGGHGWGFRDSYEYHADWKAALQHFLSK